MVAVQDLAPEPVTWSSVFCTMPCFTWWSLLLYRWASLGPRVWGLHRVLSSASFTIKLTRLLLLGAGAASSVFILGNLGQTFLLSPVESCFSILLGCSRTWRKEQTSDHLLNLPCLRTEGLWFYYHSCCFLPEGCEYPHNASWVPPWQLSMSETRPLTASVFESKPTSVQSYAHRKLFWSFARRVLSLQPLRQVLGLQVT